MPIPRTPSESLRNTSGARGDTSGVPSGCPTILVEPHNGGYRLACTFLGMRSVAGPRMLRGDIDWKHTAWYWDDADDAADAAALLQAHLVEWYNKKETRDQKRRAVGRPGGTGDDRQ